MLFRAVLFDLDGTLLATLADIASSMNAVLDGLGCPVHGEDAYRTFVGDGVENLARRALPADRRDDEKVRRAALAMREEYHRRLFDETRPYPGVPELLDGLRELGLPTAVLSNKPDDLTKLCVERLLPDWDFADVRGAIEGVPKKPDPTAALEIARELGVPPEEVLYVGDTDTDMRTAVSAGMHPAGVLWGFRDEAELQESGAEFVVARPPDLLDLIT